MIKWFQDNISNIFDFCFSRGLASEKSEWADVVRYKNTLGENVIDVIFNLEDLKNKISFKDVVYGTKYGGTTIRLPFGFVQWHNTTKKFLEKCNFIMIILN